MAVSFPKGKKLKTHKNLTGNMPPRRLTPCQTHIFPLAQIMGNPLKPLVKVGDWVRAGQKIADLDDYIATPIYSSVSGAVTDVDHAIIIESDGQYNRIEPCEIPDPSAYTTLELLWLIRDAGIVEPNGEMAHIKLNPQQNVKFVIANCAESDLYVTSKQKLIEMHSADIVDGLKIVMRIFNVRTGYIGVEAHMKNCFNSLKKEIRYDSSINLLKLKSKYPQSDEAQIIKAITGLDTPVGSIVIDARTLYDIAQAVNKRKIVTDRIVTVSGDAIKSPANFVVPLGVPLEFLLRQAGLTYPDAEIFVGGGIGGKRADAAAPVTKTVDSVLAFLPKKPDSPNKHCGLCRKCIRKCPMRINPRLLSNTEDIEKLENNFIQDCSECGLCSYICPKRRNPAKIISKNIRKKN